ncbi:hypothetical protein P9738_09825 [Bacillus siamensis]|uniref:hypothetical protein n=1 Tax=Bacillus siamensis TaxID=659243 RepID=UPI002901798D|nr:hypothetical protein [Bacillus siamensis]MDU0813207.1 hypothetical protein [Bacillus siamensis]MED5048107.1 hypothetical protein [Bacillus siamensis]MED5096527.1 hypothetical protein [Bacillus siamensis]
MKEHKKKNAATAETAVLFDTADLTKHAKELFGVKPEILQGALFGVKQKQMTKAQAQTYIQAFLTKEVMQ